MAPGQITIICCFGVAILLILNCDGLSTHRAMVVTKLSQCSGMEDLTLYLASARITQESKGNYVINGDIIVKEELDVGWATVVDISICHDAVNHDSCHKFISNNKQEADVCALLNRTNAFYSSFMESVWPVPTCPMQVITYKIVNAKIGTELIDIFPHSLPNVYWEIKIRGYYKRQMVMCIELNMHSVHRRYRSFYGK